MSNGHLATIVNSIKPVITMCKPDNDEVDIDVIRDEIEKVIAPQFKNNG